MIPGEMLIEDGDIALNVGRHTLNLKVANSGDRPIQVGSHFHFYETNPALLFDRAAPTTAGARFNYTAAVEAGTWTRGSLGILAPAQPLGLGEAVQPAEPGHGLGRGPAQQGRVALDNGLQGP